MDSAARIPAARSAAQTLGALAAALLVPGMGHAALGRRRLGAAFFGIVTATWGMGVLLGGRLPEARAEAPLTLVGAAAGWGSGLLALAARLAGRDRVDPLGPVVEYGTTYLLCAAVMNLLLILDTWERARGRKP